MIITVNAKQIPTTHNHSAIAFSVVMLAIYSISLTVITDYKQNETADPSNNSGVNNQ